MSAATELPNAAPGNLIARHPLVFFFTLTCLLTWGWDMLSWALALGLPLSTVNLVSASAPTVVAFLILAITSGKPGVLRLLRRYVRWRVGVQWYLVAVIGVAVLVFLSMAVVPGALAEFVAPDWSFVPFYLSSFVFVLFIPPGGLGFPRKNGVEVKGVFGYATARTAPGTGSPGRSAGGRGCRTPRRTQRCSPS